MSLLDRFRKALTGTAPTAAPDSAAATATVGATTFVRHGSGAAARSDVISLSKGGVVSLSKNQTVSLTKNEGPALTRVIMGLGWKESRTSQPIDLDASAILLDTAGKVIGLVWYGKKSAFGNAVKHSGDNLVGGSGKKDDEQIKVDLAALPGHVRHVVFTVNAYSGHTFDQVSAVYCRLLDDAARHPVELVRFPLGEATGSTGVFMCRLSRSGSLWTMTSIGQYQDGRTVNDMTGAARDLVC